MSSPKSGRPVGSGQNQAMSPEQYYVQLGMTAGLTAIAGSVVVGAVAFARGNKHLYNQLFKARMIATATTMGFYASASGWLPPPPLLTRIMGRGPRPILTNGSGGPPGPS